MRILNWVTWYPQGGMYKSGGSDVYTPATNWAFNLNLIAMLTSIEVIETKW